MQRRAWSPGLYHPERQQGFSLIELVIMLAIVAVLAAAGVPQVGYAMQTARERRLQQQLFGDLRLAQGEAQRRGRTVTVAPRPLDCNPSPATHHNWSCGWRVYIDNGDGNYDMATDSLITESANDTRVTVNSTRQTLRYSPIGSTSDVQTFTIGDPGTQVVVSWLGIRT